MSQPFVNGSIRIWAAFSLCCLFLLTTGCPRHISVRPSGPTPRASPPKASPPPHAAAKKSKRPGPPAHAPAHGRRAKHAYRYYPNAEVYFDSGRKIYFYLAGSVWKTGAVLPSSVTIKQESYIQLDLDLDKPYLDHAKHKKAHPPGKAKDKGKQKKTQWKKKSGGKGPQ